MSGEVIALSLAQATWEIVAAGFVSNPLALGSFAVGLAGLAAAVHEVLERRGGPAVLYGILSATGFGVLLAAI